MESVPWPPRKQATLTPQKTELYIYMQMDIVMLHTPHFSQQFILQFLWFLYGHFFNYH